MAAVPVIDLTPWFAGDRVARRTVADAVDTALREIGFLVVTGHDVPPELRARIRTVAGRFFALPEHVKRPYAVRVGERGWLPPGVEANGYSEGTETPPDLKETFVVGAAERIEDAELDLEWFRDNVYPREVPELYSLVEEYLGRMRALAYELLELCAAALGLAPDFFTGYADRPSYAMNINRYPPLTQVGRPEPGQYRIGPHTDFGTVTILDRQPGVAGLQVYTPDGVWEDAPYVEDSFTINIGDLLARWTGDRWKSNRHRVLPPDPSAPDEELMSLVFFFECNPAAVVESLAPPIGRVIHPPVRAHDYLLDKIRAISVG